MENMTEFEQTVWFLSLLLPFTAGVQSMVILLALGGSDDANQRTV